MNAMLFHAMASAACLGQEAAEAQPSTQRMGGTRLATPRQAVLVRPRLVMWPLARMSMPRRLPRVKTCQKLKKTKQLRKGAATAWRSPHSIRLAVRSLTRTSRSGRVYPESSLIGFISLSG